MKRNEKLWWNEIIGQIAWSLEIKLCLHGAKDELLKRSYDGGKAAKMAWSTMTTELAYDMMRHFIY